MTNFNIKTPPRGWVHPIAKKSIRALINNVDSEFSFVAYEGTKKASDILDNEIWCHAGILESRKTDAGWIFNLTLHCFKEDQVIPWKNEIDRGLVSEMRRWIQNKEKLPSNAPEKPRSLYLKYEITEGALKVSCFEVD